MKDQDKKQGYNSKYQLVQKWHCLSEVPTPEQENYTLEVNLQQTPVKTHTQNHKVLENKGKYSSIF